jgi:hypothetical protein
MRSGLLIVAAAALLAAPSAALAAPAAGPYHGVVKGTTTNPCGGNEGEGFFRLRATGKIAPLGTAGYCGGQLQLDQILVPSSFQCNQFNANLTVATIPVDASGAFKYTGDAPIAPGGAIAR